MLPIPHSCTILITPPLKYQKTLLGVYLHKPSTTTGKPNPTQNPVKVKKSPEVYGLDFIKEVNRKTMSKRYILGDIG